MTLDLLVELQAILERESANIGNDKREKELIAEVEDFFHTAQKKIYRYAKSIELPRHTDGVNYVRYKLLATTRYCLFMHIFEAHSSTYIHDHGGSNCAAIPLTDHFCEVCYAGKSPHKPLLNSVCELEQTQTTPLSPQTLTYLHSTANEVIHRVYSTADCPEKMLELYFPKPSLLGVYLPIYRHPGCYYYRQMDHLNVDIHTATLQMATKKITHGVYEELRLLMDNDASWIIYTPDNQIILNGEDLKRYLLEHKNTIAYEELAGKQIAL